MTAYEEIKSHLEERLAALLSRASHIEEDLGREAPDDWEENAVESEGDEVMDAVGQATMEEIRMIRESLAAIEAGTYGVCRSCGGRILAERLAALPEATTCIRCT